MPQVDALRAKAHELEQLLEALRAQTGTAVGTLEADREENFKLTQEVARLRSEARPPVFSTLEYPFVWGEGCTKRVLEYPPER